MRWMPSVACAAGHPPLGLWRGIKGALSARELQEKRGSMPDNGRDIKTLSIYIPKPKKALRPIERLLKLGEKRDRTVNYLVVQAIMEYLEREEGEK